MLDTDKMRFGAKRGWVMKDIPNSYLANLYSRYKSTMELDLQRYIEKRLGLDEDGKRDPLDTLIQVVGDLNKVMTVREFLKANL